MLAGEDFGRSEHGRLCARFDRLEHCEQGDQRLARSDIALQQAKHRSLLRHVAADFLGHPVLGTRQFVGKPELSDDRSVAL